MGCEYNEIDEPNSEENIIAQSQRKYARNVIITIILLIAGLAIYANPSLQNVKRFIAFSETTTSTTSEDTCGCPDVVTIPDCGNSENPVLGGLDFVQYFSFENESFTGKMGHSKYSETYDGYTFYFLNEKNKEAFKEDPKKYVPQYGGFCSWGMAGISVELKRVLLSPTCVLYLSVILFFSPSGKVNIARNLLGHPIALDHQEIGVFGQYRIRNFTSSTSSQRRICLWRILTPI